MNMKKKTAAAYLCLIAAVLTLAALVVYRSVMHPYSQTFLFIGAAAVLAFLSFVFSDTLPGSIMPVAASALTALGAVYGASLMVNQMGYVVSGLDDMSTITSLICFEVLAVAAMLLSILASFLPMKKEG